MLLRTMSAYLRRSANDTLSVAMTICVCAVSRAWRLVRPRTAAGTGGSGGGAPPPFPLPASPVSHPCCPSSSSNPSCVRLPAAAMTQLPGKYAWPWSCFRSSAESAPTVSRVPRIENPYGCSGHNVDASSSNTRSSGVSSTVLISSSTTLRSSERSWSRSTGRRRLFQQRLPGQPHAAALIDLEQLDAHVVALLHDVLGALGAAVLQLGDVQQPLDAGKDLDEGAERRGALHHALVHLADLGRLDHLGDDVAGPLPALAHGGNGDHAVVVHVDLGAGLLLDAADRLALGADQVADLVDRDL